MGHFYCPVIKFIDFPLVMSNQPTCTRKAPRRRAVRAGPGMSRGAGSAARPQRRGKPLGTPQASAEAPRPSRTHETHQEGPGRGRTRPRQAARPRHSPRHSSTTTPPPPPPPRRAHGACAVSRGAGPRGGLPPRPPSSCGFPYPISRDWQRLGSTWLSHGDVA